VKVLFFVGNVSIFMVLLKITSSWIRKLVDFVFVTLTTFYMTQQNSTYLGLLIIPLNEVKLPKIPCGVSVSVHNLKCLYGSLKTGKLIDFDGKFSSNSVLLKYNAFITTLAFKASMINLLPSSITLFPRHR
jgi:hypothetical protein